MKSHAFSIKKQKVITLVEVLKVKAGDACSADY